MKLSYRDIDGYYCAIVVDEDDEVSFFRGGTASRWTKPLKFTDLIAFAKAGGKGPQFSLTHPGAYADVRKALGLKPSIGDDGVGIVVRFKTLLAERDALSAQVAKLSKGKGPGITCDIRCVDCEHLNLETVRSGTGVCSRNGCRLNIYDVWNCYHGFTPAAEGCGSADQAIRAELARVSTATYMKNTLGIHSI